MPVHFTCYCHFAAYTLSYTPTWQNAISTIASTLRRKFCHRQLSRDAHTSSCLTLLLSLFYGLYCILSLYCVRLSCLLNEYVKIMLCYVMLCPGRKACSTSCGRATRNKIHRYSVSVWPKLQAFGMYRVAPKSNPLGRAEGGSGWINKFYRVTRYVDFHPTPEIVLIANAI